MNRSALLETAFVFALLEIGIWFLAGQIGWLAYLLPLLLVFRHWHKNPQEFKNNFRLAGTERDYLYLYLAFIFFWCAISLVAKIWNPSFIGQPGLAYKFFRLTALYFFWAFLQQLLLNGYFVNRLSKILPSRNLTSITAGILFAVIHLPNPVLVPLTLLGGLLSVHFFQKTRNLYLLALLHAILAVSVNYFLPHAWHHHLKIGPGFY